MTENQHNKNLLQLRKEIDAIDEQIIDLIKQRMAIFIGVLVSPREKNEGSMTFTKTKDGKPNE